ncbi:MAG: S1 RNA-binding domain-containing protein [Anaerolineales bacterium]|nr:S1 RNA-binding domain-containing protein [Anaerolineales bacterium]
MDTMIDAVQESALKVKSHLQGIITKTTLAGAIVDIGQNVPGVVHISQLRAEPVNRVEDVVQAGQTVDVWVRRIRDDRIELTMIEPLAMEWRELKPEMIVKGKVARLESYGAFVDIGAERPGLVHVSEITHGYLKTPGELLHEGDEVEAMVLEVNRRKKQIRLSIKATQPKPPVGLREEILAEAKTEPKRRRGKKGKSARPEAEAVEAGPSTPEPTAMEIAWQEAMQRAESKVAVKIKKTRVSTSREQEDILNRTLVNRLPTG